VFQGIVKRTQRQTLESQRLRREAEKHPETERAKEQQPEEGKQQEEPETEKQERSESSKSCSGSGRVGDSAAAYDRLRVRGDRDGHERHVSGQRDVIP